jgi:hypothetical protein
VVDAERARVAPVEVAALAEDSLAAPVVPALVVAEAHRAEVVVPRVAPAGERAGLLAHVALGVGPAVGAEREELHQLARVVLVRRVLRVVDAGEPEQHRRVARHVRQERVEGAEAAPPEEPVLVQHQPRRPDAVPRGCEPVVPDERHALVQRLRRPDHAVEPPQLVVAPAVEGREGAAVAVVRPRALQPVAAGPRERVHGTLEPEPGQPLGLAAARAEAGAPEEALGLRLAERSAVNGRHRAACIGAAGRRALCPLRLVQLAPQH